MGAWGKGPFDNDAARDFLGELGTSPMRTIVQFLTQSVDIPVLDVDDGGAAWAACELLALALGQGQTTSEAALEVLQQLKPNEQHRRLALRVLLRLRDGRDSELARLWKEGPDGSAFETAMTDLCTRLEAAGTGARPVASGKVGDLIGLPAGERFVLVQVTSAREIAVFEGDVADPAEACEAAANRPARRLPTSVSRLVRLGRLMGKATVRKDLKARKLYAAETGAIDRYMLATANAAVHSTVSFEEAQKEDLLRTYGEDDIRAAARGDLRRERVRSPDEREAELVQRHAAKWAERRQCTTPGPFGDLEGLRSLLSWMDDLGLAHAVENFRDLAWGVNGYGRPNEDSERQAYAFAGLVALWSGKPVEPWPVPLGDLLPPAPEPALMAQALTAARALVPQIITRDSELRLIWDGSPDGGKVLRALVAALGEALSESHSARQP
jgi:hypothetical protein